jgi:hypothetical protein
VKTQLRGEGSWCDVVGSAEGGEEVVQGYTVGYVDGRELQAPFVFVTVEEVVVSHGNIEEMTWRDASGVVIGIVGAGSSN